MALTEEEIAAWRKKLEIGKERALSRKTFSRDVKDELDGLEKDLTGFDPDFLAEVLRQLTESLRRYDGNNALRLRFARSIIKTVKPGDQMQMLLVIQMIAVHFNNDSWRTFEYFKNPRAHRWLWKYVHQTCAHVCRSDGGAAAIPFRSRAKGHGKSPFRRRRWSGDGRKQFHPQSRRQRTTSGRELTARYRISPVRRCQLLRG